MKRENQIAISLSILGIVYCILSIIVVYTLVTVIERPLKDQEKKDNLVQSLIERVERGERVLTAAQQAEKMRGFLLMIQGSDQVARGLISALKYISIALFSAGAFLLFAAFYVKTRLFDKTRGTPYN